MACPCCSKSLCREPCACVLPGNTSRTGWYIDEVGSPGDGGTWVYRTFTLHSVDPRSEFPAHGVYFGGIGAFSPDWTWKADAEEKLAGCNWRYAKWAIVIDCGAGVFQYRRIKWGIVIADCDTQELRDISDEVVNKLPGDPFGLGLGGWGPYVDPSYDPSCTRPLSDIENIAFWNPQPVCPP